MGIYQPIQTERLILREFEEDDWRKKIPTLGCCGLDCSLCPRF